MKQESLINFSGIGKTKPEIVEVKPKSSPVNLPVETLVKPSVKTVGKTELEMLDEIKTSMFNVGQTYVAAFNLVDSITAVRAANMAYRCAMYAMHEKHRYPIGKI